MSDRRSTFARREGGGEAVADDPTIVEHGASLLGNGETLPRHLQRQSGYRRRQGFRIETVGGIKNTESLC